MGCTYIAFSSQMTPKHFTLHSPAHSHIHTLMVVSCIAQTPQGYLTTINRECRKSVLPKDTTEVNRAKWVTLIGAQEYMHFY